MNRYLPAVALLLAAVSAAATAGAEAERPGTERWAVKIGADADARYRVTDRFRYVSAPALITGVLFFDFPHGQAGVAPNAVELHPVLSVTWSGTARGYQPALRERTTHRQSAKAPPAHDGKDPPVWVNTRSHVYHYPGSRWYRHTKEGKLMPENKARAEGDRPAGNS